jgi:hypothetical protein
VTVREGVDTMADEIVYTSHVHIAQDGGSLRRAWLPSEEEPVIFGVHSEIAEHYGMEPGQEVPHAATLDYVVAAAGG